MRWGNLGEEKKFISSRINFEDQIWDLDIYPKGGWKDKETIIFNLDAIDILYIILSLVLFIVLYNHLNQYRRHSIKDLTNRFSLQFFMNGLSEQNNILHAYYLNTSMWYDSCRKGRILCSLII